MKTYVAQKEKNAQNWAMQNYPDLYQHTTSTVTGYGETPCIFLVNEKGLSEFKIIICEMEYENASNFEKI